MSYHLTYLQAVVTGLVQGVTELFPVSSLGHNVLLPALIGGSWAKTLNVSATGSPYLAFIVGLHVATAIAMIAFFWRDWLRIVRGFFSSIGERRIATPDQRLAWMIILGTIPVGLVGLVLQKEVTKVLAKPELAAFFLAINGVILLVSERMRRDRETRRVGRADVAAAAPRPAFDGPSGGAGYGPSGGPGYGPAGRPAEGYQQQPRQQQWQGPDPRYGRDEWQQRQDENGNGRGQSGGRHSGGRHSGGGGQGGQYGRDQYGQGEDQSRQDQYGRDPWGQQPGQPQQPSGGAGYERRPEQGQQQRGGPQSAPGADPWAQQGRDPWAEQAADPRDPQGGWDQRAPRDPRAPQGARQQQPVGRHGDPAGRSRAAVGDAETDPAVAADRRLST